MREFHVTGMCDPRRHYMVDMSGRVERIAADYIDKGKYFTINRARQYGKTTMMFLLRRYLQEADLVLSISFEAADDCFVSMHTLAQGIVNKIARVLAMSHVPDKLLEIWKKPIGQELPLDALSEKITMFCQASEKEVILMVDEVDKAKDNQIFLNFLGLLREKYLRRDRLSKV